MCICRYVCICACTCVRVCLKSRQLISVQIDLTTVFFNPNVSAPLRLATLKIRDTAKRPYMSDYVCICTCLYFIYSFIYVLLRIGGQMRNNQKNGIRMKNAFFFCDKFYVVHRKSVCVCVRMCTSVYVWGVGCGKYTQRGIVAVYFPINWVKFVFFFCFFFFVNRYGRLILVVYVFKRIVAKRKFFFFFY